VEPGKKEWPVTGTWEPDAAHFPEGLGPIGKKCTELGIDFLVWHEPERVRPKTWLAQNHPEWMLKRTDPNNKNNMPSLDDLDMMLNLGDPDCLQWTCEHFDKLIKDVGMKCYRQDCNFNLVDYWRENESPDRAGMVENRHIQGYLAYWDYLLLNNPDLFIDSCASGGRRNDLETMRRAIPLHHTDYGYGNHVLNQAFHYSLNSWIPYYRGFKLSWDDENGSYDHAENRVSGRDYDNYTITTSSIAPSIFVGSPMELTARPDLLPYLNKMLKIWEMASPFMIHGDFYALTPNHRDSTRWTVFQFDDPERGMGFLKVIRHNQCDQASVTVQPYAFHDDMEYQFENPETGEMFSVAGKDISKKGLTFEQPMRSGAIWFYKT
jgi:alpha-galactosidase